MSEKELGVITRLVKDLVERLIFGLEHPTLAKDNFSSEEYKEDILTFINMLENRNKRYYKLLEVSSKFLKCVKKHSYGSFGDIQDELEDLLKVLEC